MTLTRPFEIMLTEVTQGQWQAFMNYNPSQFGSCGADCPVEMVNWWEAAAFANKVSQLAGLAPCYVLTDCSESTSKDMTCGGQDVDSPGKSPYACAGYRLPTSAEWEYAYRAGTETAFYNGDITMTGYCAKDLKLDAIGWYCANSGSKTHPVARKTPNAWGLYDMAGNVAEWVTNWPERDVGDVTDPLGGPQDVFLEVRGGHWGDEPERARAAARDYTSPDTRNGLRNEYIGLRLVRSRP